MPSQDYDTKDPQKDPVLHELFFSTDHDWNNPQSGTWVPMPLDPARPRPEERRVWQAHQGTSSISMESWTFYTDGTVSIPLLRRIWLKYKIGRIILRIGGVKGVLAATDSRNGILKINFRDRNTSLSRTPSINDRPRQRPLRIAKNAAGYYFIR